MPNIRNGKGHRAYRRKREALKRRTKNEHLPCGFGAPSGWGCGEQIDTTLPVGHPQAFTADHPVAINNGGHLVKQELAPMHNACNARKSDHAEAEIWEAS